MRAYFRKLEVTDAPMFSTLRNIFLCGAHIGPWKEIVLCAIVCQVVTVMVPGITFSIWSRRDQAVVPITKGNLKALER